MAKKVLKTKKVAIKAPAKAPVKAASKKSSTKPAAKASDKKKVVVKAPVKKAAAVKKPVAKPAAKAPVKKVAAKAAVVKKPVAKPAAKVAPKPAPKKLVKAVRLNPVAEPVAAPIDWTEARLKTVKTGLNKKDLDTFRELLLQHRTEIVGDVQSMEDARTVSAGDLSHMPLHMADVGSDNYDQEFTIGIMESERKILREIDEALVRMDRSIYGVCLETGQAIERKRLEAVPWTKYSKEAALRREKQIG